LCNEVYRNEDTRLSELSLYGLPDVVRLMGFTGVCVGDYLRYEYEEVSISLEVG
jgi:hypothetical protein